MKRPDSPGDQQDGTKIMQSGPPDKGPDTDGGSPAWQRAVDRARMTKREATPWR